MDHRFVFSVQQFHNKKQLTNPDSSYQSNLILQITQSVASSDKYFPSTNTHLCLFQIRYPEVTSSIQWVISMPPPSQNNVSILLWMMVR